MTLTLTSRPSKSNQFICTLNYIINQSLVKFRPFFVRYRDNSTRARTEALTDGQPENIMPPPIPVGGRGIIITFAASLCERKRYCARRRPCVCVCVYNTAMPSRDYYLRRIAYRADNVLCHSARRRTSCVRVCVCHSAMPSRDCTPQCRISLCGEGNALYPVLSSLSSAFSEHYQQI